MQRDRDRGTVTLWTLGMVLVVLFLGWLSIGLWTGFSARRELAASADQAAQAGATALDDNVFRTTGVHQLDPAIAEQRALNSLTQQNLGPLSNVSVHATTQRIVVVLEADVDPGLLTLFGGSNEPLHVRVTAIGAARN
jgi:hypothetical protein